MAGTASPRFARRLAALAALALAQAPAALAEPTFRSSIPEGELLWLPPFEVVLQFQSPVTLRSAILADNEGRRMTVDIESKGAQKTHVIAFPELGLHRYRLEWDGVGRKGADASGVLRFGVRGCIDEPVPGD